MRVGFLGTGLMGQPMIQRLLDAKVSVVAYNRTASKLEPLRVSGAEIVESPKDAIASLGGVGHFVPLPPIKILTYL